MSSFYRKMVEEKGIIKDAFSVSHEGETKHFLVEEVIENLEQSNEEVQREAEIMFSKLDFHNLDLVHYLKFLALSFLTKSEELQKKIIL